MNVYWPWGTHFSSPALQKPIILPTEGNSYSLLQVWSEVCGLHKMPLWVSVYRPAFRYQKQACRGESQAECHRVVLFLKRISEAESYLNPFFHHVSTNCHFSHCITIATLNTDRVNQEKKWPRAEKHADVEKHFLIVSQCSSQRTLHQFCCNTLCETYKGKKVCLENPDVKQMNSDDWQIPVCSHKACMGT